MDQFPKKRRYINTLSMIYIEALRRLYDNPTVHIDYTVHHGIYTEVRGVRGFEPDTIARIRTLMQELIDANCAIASEHVSKSVAMERFAAQGDADKVLSLERSTLNEVTLFSIDRWIYSFLDGVFDHTGEITSFDLLPLDRGLVLVYPNPDNRLAYVSQEKLSLIYKESERWSHLLNISHAGDLNEMTASGKIEDIILISEALHEKRIAQISDQITQKPKTRLVLIAGPSSSGKTTFSKRLAIQLRVLGKQSLIIGLDDYFLDRDKTPRDTNGKQNFDALTAVDLDHFASDVRRLLTGEAVRLPSYNFVTGKREYRHAEAHIPEGGYLIIEGIHALHDALPDLGSEDERFRIYISALTSLNIDYHNRIATTDLRLMRRMVRDFEHRGYSPEQTLSLWGNVVAGEAENIFPYQENADVMFNSSLLYELAILKPLAEPHLRSVPPESSYYSECTRLLELLSYFKAADDSARDFITNTSILREFVGGSCLKQ